MSASSSWRVRKRIWILLAVTVLFVAAFRAAVVNAARMRTYRESNCEYTAAPAHFFHDSVPDADGLTRVRFPDGSVEVSRDDGADRRMYDAQGVLREERTRDSPESRRRCRYFDARGRLCAEGDFDANGRRVGIWTVYDVVGGGARWVWFWE